MPRLSNYAQLGLLSSLLFVGCGDSTIPQASVAPDGQELGSEPPSDVPRLEPGLLSPNIAVAAAHYETATYENVPAAPYIENHHIAEAASELDQRSTTSRLPPLYPSTNTMPNTGVAPRGMSYPNTADRLARRRPMTRLPSVHLHAPLGTHVSDGWPREQGTFAISLEPAKLPQVRPARVRRSVASKPAKPPLPPLSNSGTREDQHHSVTWQASPVSLAAVADQVDTITTRGFVLAEKGALYSAKAEFHHALRAVAQALDAQQGGRDFSEALALGLEALEEAGDFADAQYGPVVDVELVVESHQTPILKPYDLSKVSPVVAMQRYYTFAQEQLVQASGRAPVAGRVFYGLGKLHMVLGEASPAAERLHGPTAMAFQQTALLIDPTNHLAANELGVLLARFGKFAAARSVLQHAVAICPLPATWQNLAIVHRELGEEGLEAQAVANWQLAVQRQQSDSGDAMPDDGSMVHWVSPQQFAGAAPGQAPAIASNVAPASQPEQAKSKTGFLWW